MRVGQTHSQHKSNGDCMGEQLLERANAKNVWEELSVSGWNFTLEIEKKEKCLNTSRFL